MIWKKRTLGNGNGIVEGVTERKRKERITLIEGAVMGLGGHLVLVKYSGIHKNELS